MKPTSRISIVIVTVCAFACPACRQAGEMNRVEHLELGEPESYLNLTLVPVYANDVFIENRKHMATM